MDRSQMSKITPITAENAMSVSTVRKCESLEATLSRVEEEARGIGKVQTTVEKVIGAGGSLREVGTRATAVGTIMEVVGDPVGTTTRQWVMFVQYPSHLALRL